MKKRLVTSALPYVNNTPHLGTLIQVLSADVFSRYCRQAGYETMYVCGTDEYGTAIETKAIEMGVTPRELCDKYHEEHKGIYEWFGINFNLFGRTSTPQQTEITQSIFTMLDKEGYISEKTTSQLFCPSCNRFLADRYIWGECPHCHYEHAKGDQCDSCGKLLEPEELINPQCAVCGSEPVLKETTHLYIDLPKATPLLEEWMTEASVKGFWANNALAMTKSWMRDGLKERCITRDLKWGIPVPKPGFEDKVFYVWFDAPIGYISITACLTDQWRDWWQNPEEVELFQFIGKDNIPFHTVIFPISLLASGEKWTMLHHMSSTEFLNYETGKFSKSKGIGIFGNDCQDTGIPADVWRFYIFYNRPEKSDSQFMWKDFQDKVNKELIGNLGNLVNRTLSFLSRFYEGKVPEAAPDEALLAEAKVHVESITEKMEHSELKSAFQEMFALSSLGNKAFQEAEPWKLRKEDPAKADRLLVTLLQIVRDLSILIRPYLPQTSDKIGSFLEQESFDWSGLGLPLTVKEISRPEILFTKLDNKEIDAFREKYAGTQVKRREIKDTPEERFFQTIDLRSAKITSVNPHPEAEKLYVITLDTADDEERTICSGLVGHYTTEDLMDKTIVLAYNLKPAKLRGIKSHGMLLAAENETEGMEVIFLEGVEPGVRLVPEGYEDIDEKPPTKKISINRFFEHPISVTANQVNVDGKALTVEGQPVKTTQVTSGKVG